MDLAEHVRVLSPTLALIIGQPLSAGSQEGKELDCEVSYTEEKLKPLFQIFGKLHCLVDDCVHLQQDARITKVGYNAYYDHKLALLGNRRLMVAEGVANDCIQFC